MMVLPIILLAVLGVPLFAVILFLAIWFYSHAEIPIDPSTLFVVMSDLFEKPFLLPIPMFTIAGFLLAESSSPRRIVQFAEAWFGWIPGGLALVAILTLTIFTAFTGASGVTIVALGGLLMPMLLEKNYDERMALGTITSSGSLGLLFFPSLPVFILSTVYSLSSPDLPLSPDRIFLAGVFPGVVLIIFFFAFAIIQGMKRPEIARIPFDRQRAVASIRQIRGEAFLPLLIIFVLQTGRISLNEIAIVTVMYVFVLEVIVRRDIDPRVKLPHILSEAMALVGAITIILIVILGMNNYLIDAEIPNKLLAWIEGFVSSKWMFLFLLNIFLLVVGCLMDIFSAILAVLPLLIPLAARYDIAPAHLAVVFLANLEVGFLTPPVGMNLFISSFHFRKPVLEVYKSVIPFMGLLLAALLTITYVPALSTWLPDTILGPQVRLTDSSDQDLGFDEFDLDDEPGGDSGGLLE